MGTKSYLIVTGVIFGVIAVVHLLRLIYGLARTDRRLGHAALAVMGGRIDRQRPVRLVDLSGAQGQRRNRRALAGYRLRRAGPGCALALPETCHHVPGGYRVWIGDGHTRGL